jgi:hypothetical protein
MASNDSLIDKSNVKVADFPQSRFRMGLGLLYKKTSADNEEVAGMQFEIDTSSTNYAKLSTGAAGKAKYWGTFEKQPRPGMVGEEYVVDYALDGKEVKTIMPWLNPALVKNVVVTGQTIAQFQMLEGAAGGGVQAFSTGPMVGYSLNAVTSSDTYKTVIDTFGPPVFMNSPFFGTYFVDEAITVATASHLATLTETPILIESVVAVTQTSTASLIKRWSTTTVVPMINECYINKSAKTVLFSSTDAVTHCRVSYWARGDL